MLTFRATAVYDSDNITALDFLVVTILQCNQLPLDNIVLQN